METVVLFHCRLHGNSKADSLTMLGTQAIFNYALNLWHGMESYHLKLVFLYMLSGTEMYSLNLK